MSRIHVAAVAGTVAGACLGMLLAFQAGAQGHSGGARPAGGLGGANAGGRGSMRIGVDRGWPRGPEIQAPSRLPQDQAFGEKGKDASAKKGDNASAAASADGQGNANAEAGGVKAQAAIAAAGTGDTTGKGQGGEAGAEGRAMAAAAVSAGTGADASGEEENGGASERGRSTAAPGQTGQTGLAQAVLRADEHAAAGLEKAQGNQQDRGESDLEADSRKNSSK